MSKTKILKIILIIVFSYFSSAFIKTKLNINYDSVVLNANIDFFNTDQSALANRKLHTLPVYGTIAGYFTPKKMAFRLNREIKNSNICGRVSHAKKRNAKILPDETSINISLIFIDKSKAQRCLKEIQNFIISQKKTFLGEAEASIESIKNRQKIISSNKTNSNLDVDELLKSYFIDDITDENTITNYLKILQLRSTFSEIYNLKELDETFSLVKESEIFTLNSNITGSSDEILKGLEFEYLFLLVFVLLCLIFYRRNIESYFKKIKNKL